MHVTRAVLYDLTDVGRGSTLRLLDESGQILLQGHLCGQDSEIRDLCLRIVAACDVALEYVGPGASIRRSPPLLTLDPWQSYEVARPVEVRKGKSTGQCLLF